MLATLHNCRNKKRLGNISVLTAVCLVPLTGMLALTLDSGICLDDRRKAQTAADLAALAAVTDLYQKWNTNHGVDSGGTAKSSALGNASFNGFDNNGTTNTVAVYFNPSTYQMGLLAGSTIPVGTVEAVITYYQSRYFSSIWGSSPVPIKTHAVARASYTAAAPTFLVLDPSGTSVNMSGTEVINLSGGSFVVNSSSASGLLSSGSPGIQAGEFYFSGKPGYTYSGSSPLQNNSGSTASSSIINSGVTATPDPLAALPVPALPSSDGTMSVNGGSFESVSSSYVISGTSPVTLTPGHYPNGFIASGSSMVTLQPGIYYMGGGITVSGSIGFQVSGPSDSQTGTGVMFYSTAAGGLNFSGTGPLNIPAPSTGTYQNISIFQARTSTAALTLSGSENWNWGGTMYAAGGTINLSGSSSATYGSTIMGAQYICNKINISGSGTITVSGGNGTPVRTIQLIQ
jgi:hypothetical protein